MSNFFVNLLVLFVLFGSYDFAKKPASLFKRVKRVAPNDYMPPTGVYGLPSSGALTALLFCTSNKMMNTDLDWISTCLHRNNTSKHTPDWYKSCCDKNEFSQSCLEELDVPFYGNEVPTELHPTDGCIAEVKGYTDCCEASSGGKDINSTDNSAPITKRFPCFGVIALVAVIRHGFAAAIGVDYW